MAIECLGTVNRSTSRLANYGGGRVSDVRSAVRERVLRGVIDGAAGTLRTAHSGGVHEVLPLRGVLAVDAISEDLVGSSPALQAVLRRMAQVAPTDSTVLITGETGTGKELIARAIHKRSPRSARPFVSANCAAIPQSLITSELFGHERGAFTGAVQRRIGRFEAAAGGTLFLDEVGELPADTQMALLRVLQEREFERVGGSTPIRADVRVVTATNRDLDDAIAAGTFRSDLYYRLNVFPLEMPPLRERREDIRMLVEYFVDRYARRAGKTIRSISVRTLELLETYAWPGNVRELQNIVERSLIMCEGDVFSVEELSLPCAPATHAVRPAGVSPVAVLRPVAARQPPQQATLEEIQREAILRALQTKNWVVGGPNGAAALLGLKRTTLQARMHKLGIAPVRPATATGATR
jgi:transcriptional regulator with GAF, ATPase, and Fis domain